MQKDVTSILNEGRIFNDASDQVERIVGDDVFDIYAGIERDGRNILFGCIQAKTSMRDRVVRDRGFSIPMMANGFWSAPVVLDGKYLSMPKFEHMVNGGSEQFQGNEWHGVYSLSNAETNNRIREDNN